ncbi:hypothetical protein [Clostridium novyi]|uniref:Uncharacterized protein n=1 Tax=Clostridium novyi (strain NT) TaxID=386415 RepID=A0Q3J5_CLONN|nr:hypothetical protein [Clostridium novyi]ABK62070.1 hypothetical protein NT01CX_0731 [Clostridium novyi NT]
MIDEDIKNTKKNYRIIDHTPKEKNSFDVAIIGVDKNGHTIVDLSKLDEYHRKNKEKH